MFLKALYGAVPEYVGQSSSGTSALIFWVAYREKFLQWLKSCKRLLSGNQCYTEMQNFLLSVMFSDKCFDYSCFRELWYMAAVRSKECYLRLGSSQIWWEIEKTLLSWIALSFRQFWIIWGFTGERKIRTTGLLASVKARVQNHPTGRHRHGGPTTSSPKLSRQLHWLNSSLTPEKANGILVIKINFSPRM